MHYVKEHSLFLLFKNTIKEFSIEKIYKIDVCSISTVERPLLVKLIKRSCCTNGALYM